MTEKERIQAVVTHLNAYDEYDAIPLNRMVVVGSGAMTMHGMDRKPDDVDIFTTTENWFRVHRSCLISDHLSPWNVFITDPDDPETCCDPAYLYRPLYGITISLFAQWRMRPGEEFAFNPAKVIADAEMVDGVPCTPLDYLLRWKKTVRREKDKPDIEMLEEHLNGDH